MILHLITKYQIFFKNYFFLFFILFCLVILLFFNKIFFFFFNNLIFYKIFKVNFLVTTYTTALIPQIIYKFKLYFIFYFLLPLIKILSIFIAVAFFTLAERKILGAIHRRRGPSLVGIWGLLQPIADALKLFIKELIYPKAANSFIFLSAPCWILVLSVFSWYFIPFHLSYKTFTVYNMLNVIKETFFFPTFNSILLFILALSSLNVYGIILAGWSSNSKYAFLGGLRSAAQMISYEVSFGLTILPIIILSMTLDLNEISIIQKETTSFLFSLLPCFYIFLISILAETNRTPFDLPEAEAELVAGYNVEYSAITFAMFFLGEYSSMILMSSLSALLFFGGIGIFYHFFFPIKILIFCFFFVWVRGTVPRFRYDQLMQLCWKVLLPIMLSFLFLYLLFFFMEKICFYNLNTFLKNI